MPKRHDAGASRRRAPCRRFRVSWSPTRPRTPSTSSGGFTYTGDGKTVTTALRLFTKINAESNKA